MKKKKIILLGLILVLFVLIGVLAIKFFGENKDLNENKGVVTDINSSYGLYGLNSFYFTDDFKIYFINQEGEKQFGFNEKLVRRQDCLGGPFIQYFIKEDVLKEYIDTSQEEHYSTQNPELFRFLYTEDLVQKSKDSCNPENYFYINDGKDDLIIARSLYNNDAEYEDALQLANKNFESYLDDLNANCNECLLIMKYVDNGIAMGPYRYSTGELLFEENKENNILKSNVYTDFNQQIQIYFQDGYLKYSDTQIGFGPVVEANFSPDPSVDIPHRSFLLEIKDHKSLEDLMIDNQVRNTESEIIKIADFEAIKYQEGGVCEERVIEVVGKQYNYKFSSDGCINSRDYDFNYLEEEISGMEIISEL